MAIVPSFNRDSSENLDGCIRTLSKFSKTAMVCVNSFGVAGTEMEARAESFCHVVGKPMTCEETIDGAQSNVGIFTYDLDQLRASQATPYGDDGIHSGPFKAILTGSRGGAIRGVRL